MAEPNERDRKLIQYLGEAHAKEKELEVALESHIRMTSRRPYKRRLQQHLKETKDHSRQLERRIKKLGGGTDTFSTIAAKAIATAKGPLHAFRTAIEAEKMLKNAKTEYSDEHEEIATYTAIEAFAERVGDRETAKLARGIRREEERMAAFLQRLIPQLTRAVVQDWVPADQRGGARGRRSRRRTKSSRRGRTTTSSHRGRSGQRGSGARRSRSGSASSSR
jgi:ferritin-like metal-binding protein YciE